jgi:low temperature requirement protein LtrA
VAVAGAPTHTLADVRLTRNAFGPAAAPGDDEPVTSLELFFDLVFVFTITQLTDLVLSSDGLQGYGEAGLVLVITWWMYDGYAWLTNNVGPTTTSTRIPLLVAMAGFLVMAITTPDAFGPGRWLFPAAYLGVVLVHGVSFARSALGTSAQAIKHILPWNVAVAACLFGAALAPAGDRWLGWLAGVLVLVLALATRREGGFALRVDHFAERHQLLIIVALGETVVATGVGARGRLTDGWVLIAVLLSLALISVLWWVYFGLGGDRGLTAINAAGPRGTTLAIWGYSMSHLLHIAGLVLVAAALHVVVRQPTDPLGLRMAVTMAGGAALFLLGELLFERRLSIGRGSGLAVAAACCLAIAPTGYAAGVLELAALAAVVAVFVTSRRTAPRLDIRT